MNSIQEDIVNDFELWHEELEPEFTKLFAEAWIEHRFQDQNVRPEKVSTLFNFLTGDKTYRIEDTTELMLEGKKHASTFSELDLEMPHV